MAKKKKILSVQGREIALIVQEKGDYISLTDMARKFEGDPRDHIRNWLRNGSTVEFLGVWEKVHNPDFNVVQFHHIRAEFTRNTFLMSVSKWIENTGVIGITAKAGRYGGTYAHSDIAVQFATWLSPEFYVYLVKEFQRLKVLEAQERHESLEWTVRRILTKINYSVHTDAIKETLIPPRLAQNKTSGLVYAGEADILYSTAIGFVHA